MPRESTKIWTHFDRKANAFALATCKYCNLTLSFRTTTGNLNSHLKRSHSSIYYADWKKTAEDIKINSSVTIEENSPLDVGTVTAASTSSIINQAIEQLNRPCKRRSPTLTPKEGKQVNQDSQELFITTYEPFRVVRRKEISDSIQKNPDSSLLPKKTISSVMIPTLHQGTDTKNETPTANSRNLFCICCLQMNTPLINLQNCNHSDFLDQFSKPELNCKSQYVCFLCHTVLKKIKLFKIQVENSFKILLDQAAFVNNTKQGLYNLKMYNAVDILISDKLKNPIKISLKGNSSHINKNCSQNNNAVKFKNITTALDIINKNNQSSSFVNPFIQTTEYLTKLSTALASKKKNSDKVDLNELENMRSEIPTTGKRNIKPKDKNLDSNIESEFLEFDNVDKYDSSENLRLKNVKIPASDILNIEVKDENLDSNVTLDNLGHENTELLASGILYTKIKDENIDILQSENTESENFKSDYIVLNVESHNQDFGSVNLRSENPNIPGDIILNTKIMDESADPNIKSENLEFENVESSGESNDSILSKSTNSIKFSDSTFESTNSSFDLENLESFKSTDPNVESEILESDKIDIPGGVTNIKRKSERSEVESKKIKLESTDEPEAIMLFDSPNEFEQEQEINPLKQELREQVNTIDVLEQETNQLEVDLNHIGHETNQLELEINHLEDKTNELEQGTSRLEEELYKFPTESNNSNQKLVFDYEVYDEPSKVNQNENNDKPNKVDQETKPEQNQFKQEPNLLQYDSIFEEESNEIKSEIDIQLEPIGQESNLLQKYLNNIVLVPEQNAYQQKLSQFQLETNQHEQRLDTNQSGSILPNTNKLQEKLNKTKAGPSRILSKKSQKNKLSPNSREVCDQIITMNISVEELNEEREKLVKEEGYMKCSFKCKRCILGFNFEENLMDHISRKHAPSGDNSITCEVCSQVIKGKDYRLRYELHTTIHFVRHACAICSKRFVFYEDAQQHVFKEHHIFPSASPAPL